MQASVKNFISEGDFKKAVQYFDEQLGIDPNAIENIGGYFATRFWSNRQELIAKEMVGKHRATFLLAEWDSFEEEADRRKIMSLPVVDLIMQYVFGLAAKNLRLVYQKEASRSIDPDFFSKLGLCLLRCKDYSNCIDVMEYAGSQYGSNPEFLFYLAESYYRVNNLEKSKLYWREALFLNTDKIEFALIETSFILDLIKQVDDFGYAADILLDWVFIYGLVYKTFDIYKSLSQLEVKNIFSDIQTLEKNYLRISPDLKEKVKTNLLKKYLYLLDYYQFQDKSSGYFSDIAQQVRELDEEVYKLYTKQKKGF